MELPDPLTIQHCIQTQGSLINVNYKWREWFANATQKKEDPTLKYSLEGLTDTEVEVPILCSPDAKSWLIGKDPDSGKD